MPESKGRPGSAGQRPTGGDKAVATQKKQFFRRKKVCRFCVEKIDDINYKDVKMLHAFVAERGKIVPRRILACEAPEAGREMVLNWALLLPAAKVNDFRARVGRANAEHQLDGLGFEVSGPWPPYSFCPVWEDEPAGQPAPVEK